jgi:transposase
MPPVPLPDGVQKPAEPKSHKSRRHSSSGAAHAARPENPISSFKQLGSGEARAAQAQAGSSAPIFASRDLKTVDSRPTRKRTPTQKAAEMAMSRSPGKTPSIAGTSKERPTRYLEVKKSSEKISTADGSASGSAPAERRLRQSSPADEKLRARVLKLLSEGMLQTEVQQVANVSKRKVQRWKDDGIAAGILRQSLKKAPRKHYDETKRARVFELLGKKEGLKNIVRETGVSKSTILAWREKGIAAVLQNPEVGNSATEEVLSHHDRKYEEVITLLNQGRTIKTISQKTNLPELKISEWKIKAIAAGTLLTNSPRKYTRKRSDTKTRAEVLALPEQGESITHVAKAKGFPPDTVEGLEAKALAPGELNANKSKSLRPSHKAGTKDKVMALRGKRKPQSHDRIVESTSVPSSTVPRRRKEREQAPAAKPNTSGLKKAPTSPLAAVPDASKGSRPGPPPEPESPQNSESSSEVLIPPTKGSESAERAFRWDCEDLLR